MRAFMLVGTLIALAITGYLYKTKLKSDEAKVQQAMGAAGMPAAKSLQQAPQAIGDHVKALQKQQLDAAERALDER